MRPDKQNINFASKEVVNYSAIANKAKSLSDGIRSIDFDRINDSIVFNSSLVHNRPKIHVKPSNNSVNNVSEINFNDNSTLTGITSDSSNTDPTKAISSMVMIDVNNRIEQLESKTQNQTATANETTFTGNVTADTFNGYHLGFNNRFYTIPAIPVIGPDLVMEVGRYIDFHYNGATGTDKTSRLYISKPGTLYYDHSFVVNGGDIKARNCIADGGDLNNIASRTKSLESKNTEQDTRLTNIETKNTEQDERLDALESKDIAQDERLGSIEAMDTAQNETLSNINTKNDEQDTRLTNIETKNTEQDTRLTNIETKNTEQDERIGSIEAMDTAQNETISIINTKNNEQDTRLDTLEIINTEQDTRIYTLDRKDLEQDTRLDTLESKNTEQDFRLVTIEQNTLRVSNTNTKATLEVTNIDENNDPRPTFRFRVNLTFQDPNFIPTFTSESKVIIRFRFYLINSSGGATEKTGYVSADSSNGLTSNFTIESSSIQKGSIELILNLTLPLQKFTLGDIFEKEYNPDAIITTATSNQYIISKNLTSDNDTRLSAAVSKNNEQDTRLSKLESKIASLLNSIYPVGSIYLSLTKSPPSLGGTWELIDEGKFLYSTTTTSGETGGSLHHVHKTSGHVLTVGEMPMHKHTFNGNKISGTVSDIVIYDGKGMKKENPTGCFSWEKYGSQTWQGQSSNNAGLKISFTATPTGSISYEGNNQAHTHGDTEAEYHIPPYITCFMYKRTA